MQTKIIQFAIGFVHCRFAIQGASGMTGTVQSAQCAFQNRTDLACSYAQATAGLPCVATECATMYATTKRISALASLRINGSLLLNALSPVSWFVSQFVASHLFMFCCAYAKTYIRALLTRRTPVHDCCFGSSLFSGTAFHVTTFLAPHGIVPRTLNDGRSSHPLAVQYYWLSTLNSDHCAFSD